MEPTYTKTVCQLIIQVYKPPGILHGIIAKVLKC